MTSLPSKLFFRIGEVAGLVGVEPHVLRYWEREFRSIRPTKSAKGQRVYSRKDVENLLRVRDLLYRDGFTIAGAKKRLQRAPGEAEEQEQVAGDVLHAAPHPAPHAAPHALASERAIDDDDEEEELGPESGAVLSPASSPAASASTSVLSASAASREKLTALRIEVEAFLDELETRDGDADPHERA